MFPFSPFSPSCCWCVLINFYYAYCSGNYYGNRVGFLHSLSPSDQLPSFVVDDEKAEAVEGANITTYTLKKLKPYTTYKIYVLIIGAAGQSPRSDPIRVITSEGGKREKLKIT